MMEVSGLTVNVDSLPILHGGRISVAFAGELDTHPPGVCVNRDIVRMRIAQDEIAARLGSLINQGVTYLLAGWKARIVPGTHFVGLGAQAQRKTSFEDKDMLFLEHVEVCLVGLPTRRQDLHGDADLGTTAKPAEVLIAHAEALTAKDFFPRDATDVEWFENAFSIDGCSFFAQRDSPNVGEP